MDLTLLMLALNERENLSFLLPEIINVLNKLNVSKEIIIVDGGSTDGTVELAESLGVKLIIQKKPFYGEALKEGISNSKGKYIITLDADCSHPASMIMELWENRDKSDILISSRYIEGGSSEAPFLRRKLSQLLNVVYSGILSIPVKDLSSGLRIYRRSILDSDEYASKDFDILIEVLVVAFVKGHSIAEVPLSYQPRRSGVSNAKIVRLYYMYLSTLFKLRKMRNDANSADYDHRAYDSLIPLQRYWQRERYRIIKSYILELEDNILDIGCGSSRIIQSNQNAIAFDYSFKKLKFLSKTNKYRAQGSTFNLPFATQSFNVVIHSQLLEHVPFESVIFEELNRVTKMNGVLIIGTPDYATFLWPIIEYFYGKILPNAYADEHITHYTKEMLFRILDEHKFKVIDYKYICKSELIVKCVKIKNLMN
jgi:glycosyltransferase involved in cell wall biosynthesis